MNNYSVEATHLSVKFGDFVAVNDISFSVEKGEIFGFLGANGAGKTTTIRVLCGLLTPTSGDVHISGSTYAHGEEKIKSKVGYMSQKFTLYNDLTIQENFDFTGALRRLQRDRINSRVKELTRFINLQKPLNTLVKDLPGGIKQQVSLAASILHDPEIIFLDEPTAGVTPAARARFWQLIRSLASQGKTVFVTTHYLDEAENCQRIALMRSGEIIALDKPEVLKKKTFPLPIYELDPLSANAEEIIDKLKSHASVEGIDNYGFRFHVIIKDQEAWNLLQPELSKDFAVNEIPPSLEDVFIRLVEGTKR